VCVCGPASHARTHQLSSLCDFNDSNKCARWVVVTAFAVPNANVHPNERSARGGRSGINRRFHRLDTGRTSAVHPGWALHVGWERPNPKLASRQVWAAVVGSEYTHLWDFQAFGLDQHGDVCCDTCATQGPPQTSSTVTAPYRATSSIFGILF
jgi:hypothetical protein